MKHWLLKTDPDSYSWTDFEQDGETIWDGVRNFQARNNIRSMEVGDLAIIYHSVTDKSAMGIAELISNAIPDPKADANEGWLAVHVRLHSRFARPVPLQTIKTTLELSEIALIKQSRLSVMPLSEKEFSAIVNLGTK